MSISINSKVSDALLPVSDIPVVHAKTLFKETLEIMGDFRLGIACLVDEDGKLMGIITDGDIRRKLLKDQKPFAALFANDSIHHANTSPAVVIVDQPLSEAIELMEKKEIQDLPVIDKEGKLAGLLHLHTVVKISLGI